MALGDIRFTEKQRKRLNYLLVTLILCQAMIGLVLFLLGISVSSSIGGMMNSVDEVVVKWVFAILGMFGFYVLAHNLVGAKLCSNFINFAEGPGMNLRLFIWTFVGIIIAGVGCILASVCIATADYLVSQIHRSFYRGMMQYFTSLSWKSTLDELQIEMQCCGLKSFKDWYKTSWMHHDILNESSPIILKYAELDGRVLPPVVPWSCCRPDAKSPCYHDPLQLPNPDQDLVTETLYTDGCLTAMKGPVVRSLFSTIPLAILLTAIQVAITVLSRLAFTASRNAVVLGNRYGPSPGWFYGRLDFGNATGPNVLQLYRKSSGRGNVMVDLKPLVYASDTE